MVSLVINIASIFEMPIACLNYLQVKYVKARKYFYFCKEMNKEAWFMMARKYEIFVKFCYAKILLGRVIFTGKYKNIILNTNCVFDMERWLSQ